MAIAEGFLLFPFLIMLIIPLLISYFIIKTAVKNAIKELKRDDII